MMSKMNHWENGIYQNKKREQMSRKRLPVLLSNFLLVCLSPTETCQRIRSPPCRGSFFSISNSTSCKCPPPTPASNPPPRLIPPSLHPSSSSSPSSSSNLLFVFYYGNLSHTPTSQCVICLNTNCLHHISSQLPPFVVQNLSFVWARVKRTNL